MNVVVILVDDMRYDLLWSMPVVQRELIEKGIWFNQAIVSTPICCPSRASFLSGGNLARHTGVLTNSLPDGGATKFDDHDTLATKLQTAGYKTAMIGKYMNGYNLLAPYIPPGWNRFVTKYRGDWVDYSTIQGQSTSQAGQGEITLAPNQYITDYLTDQTLEFMTGVGSDPFFVLLSMSAPHAPATPAPEDMEMFSDYVYRDRAYEEGEPQQVVVEDEFHRNQLRSLQSVDRNIQRVVNTIETLGKTSNTMIVFMSDNGYHWGEHGLYRKGSPYQESIRVPLVVVYPGAKPRVDHKIVTANLDIPATILSAARVPYVGDGRSMLQMFVDRTLRIRPEGQYIEAYKMGGIPLAWRGWHTQAFTYVIYETGERQLYDLSTDPYEQYNVIDDPYYMVVVWRMEERLYDYQDPDM